MKKNKSGFTLVELIMVVVIITILLTIIIPAGTTVQNRARVANRRGD